MNKTVNIIVPAYNEENRIQPMLQAYADFFSEWSTQQNISVTLTVVVNGTTDQTEHVVQSIIDQRHDTLIDMLVIPAKIGKGGAVYEGWKQSQSSIVGFVDADGSTSPEEYSKLLDYYFTNTAGGIRGVIGSRFIGGATVLNRTSPLRTLMSHTFITIIQWIFWLPFKDTQCGAKIFDRTIVMDVMPQLRERGMEFDVELLWRLHQTGNRIVELPTVWEDKPGSAKLRSKWDFIRVGVSMVWKLLMLRFRG